MKRKIIEFEKSQNNRIDYLEKEFFDGGNEFKININLYENLLLFDPLSMGRQKSINPEISSYIDTKISMIPVKYPIKFYFFHCKLSEEDQREFIEILKEYYNYTLMETRKELRVNIIKSLCLTAIGAIFFGLYFAFNIFSENPLFLEVLSIVGSFSIWEAVNAYLLDRRSLKKQWLNAGRSALCKIEFISGNYDKDR